MIRLCIVIFLLAFALRFSSTLRYPPAPDNEYESTRVAISLAQRGEFADPYIIPTGPTAHVAPAFPMILSLVYRAFGYGTAAEIAKRVLNCFVSSLQYALLPWVAMVCGLSEIIGLSAGFFGALAPLQRYAESASSWESSWAAILLMLLVVMTRRARSSVAYGVTWGIALLFAPALAIVYAGFIWLFRHRPRFIAVSIAITILCLTPWAYRNKQQLGNWIWLRDNFGLELSVSNQDRTTPRLSENLLAGYHDATHPHGSVAEASSVRELGEVEYNRRRLHQALQWIGRNPGYFAELTAARAFYFWFPWVASPLQRFLLMVMTLLATIGLACTYHHVSYRLAARPVESVAPGRAARLPTLPGDQVAEMFAIIWLAYPIVYYVIEFDRRYRHPIEWSLLLMAAQGAFAIGERIIQRKVL